MTTLPDHARWQKNEVTVNVDEETRQLLILELQGNPYAADGQWVKEIVAETRITFVPGLPPHFLGITNVRGDLESVVDVGQFLGIGEVKRSPVNRTLLVRRGRYSVGLLVDYVTDMVDVPMSHIQKEVRLTGGVPREYVLGELTYHDRAIMMLDLGRVIDAIIGPEES